jgi:hypothetical protein
LTERTFSQEPEPQGSFTLVDDSLVAQWNGVAKQLFNSDLLAFPTNSNGALQSPFGRASGRGGHDGARAGEKSDGRWPVL